MGNLKKTNIVISMINYFFFKKFDFCIFFIAILTNSFVALFSIEKNFFNKF